MSERKPLTLEELREMYNCADCIGVHVLLRVNSVVWIEGVIDHRDDDGICAVYAANGEWLKEKDYGKTWAAYATEPQRLDRSALEPCEVCGKADGLITANYATEDMQGFTTTNHILQAISCPKCGRPLTDADWDMLEKRLENAK